MRPASKSINYFDDRMGNYFNLHPNCMGTFTEINEISKVIRASQKGIMIGDSSLIGAACTFWQQIAIGNQSLLGRSHGETSGTRCFLKVCVRKGHSPQ